mmetsp:Transcript_11116/g.21568  ORF Transcript_11116/g.21568 Transcript_11116/m.21568 type:complete len:259 (-) Transcript_11116:95-871(-)
MGREGGVRAQGRAVLLAFGFDPALKKSCVLRLGQHDLDFRAIGFESLAHTVERASRAVARHPVVKLLALKVVEDLLAGGGLVELPVGLVLELVAEEPAVLLAQLLRLAHHARALARLGCHNHLCAEHAHESPPLDGEGLGHGDDALVAALRADHGDGDAGIARGGLDHRVARLEHAALLRVLDDREGQPVLDRRERVEKLALGVDGHALGNQLLRQLNHRRVADGMCHILIKHSPSLGEGRCAHAQGRASAQPEARAG